MRVSARSKTLRNNEESHDMKSNVKRSNLYNCTIHCSKTLTRCVVVILSTVHAGWVPLTYGIAATAAASFFGDKGYMASLPEKTQKIADQEGSDATIRFIEDKLSEYTQWRSSSSNDALGAPETISKLNYQLAIAKAAADAPKKDITEAYKKVLRAPYCMSEQAAALAWLSRNTSKDEYRNIVNSLARHSKTINGAVLAAKFESTKNWSAFEMLLDALFERTNNLELLANSVQEGLPQSSPWVRQYYQYCRNNPKLRAYTFGRDKEIAEKHAEMGNFKKAAELYRDLAKRSSNDQERAMFELAVCECLSNDGQFESAVSGLDSFIAKYRKKELRLIPRAVALKAQCCISHGELDMAVAILQSLLVDYPNSPQAPKAGLSIGYIHMLQGGLDKANEAFKAVVQNYPQSSDAAKAKMYLERIEKMNQIKN